MHEAILWEPAQEGKVKCRLCAHGCLIKPGRRGICQVRQNQEGRLYTLVWGKPIAANLDPIEKKPLFHFLPGTTSFSIATIGCNFQCDFCQNWDISQQQREHGGQVPGGGPGGREVPPATIVERAKASGAASISYTYTEPTIYFEYARDCMALAVERGLKNVFVSNGYESAECIEACAGLLHAANIDLKAFNDEFYKKQCKAKLAPVLDTLRRVHQAGIWLEVTTLLIPGQNDDPGELGELTAFIVSELSPQVPWHVSRFHPDYKLQQVGPTPLSALEMAARIGKEAGLQYVYAGNVPGHESESTRCPSCNDQVLRRFGFSVGDNTIDDGACPSCGQAIAGVWS